MYTDRSLYMVKFSNLVQHVRATLCCLNLVKFLWLKKNTELKSKTHLESWRSNFIYTGLLERESNEDERPEFLRSESYSGTQWRLSVQTSLKQMINNFQEVWLYYADWIQKSFSRSFKSLKTRLVTSCTWTRVESFEFEIWIWERLGLT